MHRILVLMILALAVMSCWRDPMDRAKALSAVAAYQAEAGETDAARESIGLAVEMLRDFHHGDDPEALRAIAWAQAKTGDIADARATGRGEAWYAESLGLVTIVQIRKGDNDGAKETLRIALGNLKAGGRVPEAIVIAQALLGDMRAAIANSALADGEEPVISLLQLLAGLQAEAGDLVGMETTLALFQERHGLKRAFDPELRFTDMLIEILIRVTGRDWAGAGRTIDEYEASLRDLAQGEKFQDAAPSAITAARHFLRAREALHNGDEETAWQAFRQAGQATADIPDSMMGELLRVAAICARALAGDKTVLEYIGPMMEDTEFELAAFGIVALARAIRGEAAGAEEAIARAEAEARGGKEDPEDIYPPLALQARLVLGDKAGALQLIELDGFETEPFPMESVVRILAGEVRLATMLAVDWFTYNEIIWSTRKIGHAALLARAGDYDSARRMALGIASDESTDNLRQRPAHLAMRLGQADEAITWVKEIPDEKDRLKAFMVLAEAMIEAGQDAEARLVADMVEGELYRPAKDRRYHETGSLAVLLARLGEPAGATRIADDLLPAGNRVTAYREIAGELVARGDRQAALAILAGASGLTQGLTSTRSRAWNFPAIAQDRAALGDQEGALADAHRARQAARAITAPASAAQGMAKAALALAAADSQAEAEEAMMLAVNAATSLRNKPKDRAKTLVSFAETAGEAGLRGWKNEALTRAWSAAAEIKDVEDRGEIQQRIHCARTKCPPEQKKKPFEGVLAGVTANPFERVREAVALARGHVASGDFAAAQSAMDRATDMIGTLNDPLLRAKVWMLVAEVNRETGHDTAAARHLNRATEELATDDAAWYRAWTLIGIAERHEQAGRHTRAIDNARLAAAALREP